MILLLTLGVYFYDTDSARHGACRGMIPLFCVGVHLVGHLCTHACISPRPSSKHSIQLRTACRRKLYKQFYKKPKKQKNQEEGAQDGASQEGTFDISKIPDIYDSV